jgi:hypothetical protein
LALYATSAVACLRWWKKGSCTPPELVEVILERSAADIRQHFQAGELLKTQK